MNSMSLTQSVRVGAISLMCAAAAFGLLSRTVLLREVPVIGPWSGDTCWAIAAWFLLRAILPRVAALEIAVLTSALCLIVETSQLLDVEWLQNLRQYPVIRMLIGSGFIWTDLVLYAVGIGISWALDRRILMRIFGRSQSASSN